MSTYACLYHGSQERESDALELELQAVVSFRHAAKNQTQVFCKTLTNASPASPVLLPVF